MKRGEEAFLIRKSFLTPTFEQLLQTADYPQLGSATTGGAAPPNDYAKPDDITLTVGPNDIDFVDWLKECYDVALLDFPNIAPPACNSPANDSLIESEIHDTKANLDKVLAEIQNRAVTAGKIPQVYVTGYYDPFPANYPSSPCSDLVPVSLLGGGLTSDEMNWIRNKLLDLNSAIHAAASVYPNVHYVDITNVMQPSATQPSHTYCSSDPWVYGVSILVPSANRQNPAPFHPTPNGQFAIFKAIQTAIGQ
jgi:hypothetical protein